MSLKQEKEFKAEQKRKQEINIKIRRADKNLKALFMAIKQIMNKPDEDYIIPGLPITVAQAKFARE